jgi:CRP-like cAMP-binding protein
MIAPNVTLMVGTECRPRNRLLAALPDEALWSLRPHLRTVSLPRGSVLCESGERLSRVYFPETGAISLVTVFEDGSTAEMATVGREGVVGIGTLLGGEHAFGRHVVPVAGSALAVEASRFRRVLRENGALRAACETYAQAFLAHLLQNVACNAIHKVDQRCARWLLMCDDQAEGDSFELTQEYLAELLGVRRSTVTVVAGGLQREGLIHYRRGAVTVLDRRGLEMTACECYQVVRDTYGRPLLPASLAGPPPSEMAAIG